MSGALLRVKHSSKAAVGDTFDLPRCVLVLCAGDVLRDMGLRDAFNVQLSVPALNGDAVTAVLRSLNCFNAGEVLQVG